MIIQCGICRPIWLNLQILVCIWNNIFVSRVNAINVSICFLWLGDKLRGLTHDLIITCYFISAKDAWKWTLIFITVFSVRFVWFCFMLRPSWIENREPIPRRFIIVILWLWKQLFFHHCLWIKRGLFLI
jgi:hypothetical protein